MNGIIFNKKATNEENYFRKNLILPRDHIFSDSVSSYAKLTDTYFFKGKLGSFTFFALPNECFT